MVFFIMADSIVMLAQMRLLTYRKDGLDHAGVLTADGIVPFGFD